MMKAFLRQGHEVVAVGPESERLWAPRFRAHGIVYKKIHVRRNGANPLDDLRTFMDLMRFMKHESPKKVFAYQAKTIVYGSIAAKLRRVPEIYLLIAGLGSVFRGAGIKNRLLRAIMKIEFRIASRICRRAFFQNTDDLRLFVESRIINEAKTIIINGSGVNLQKFSPVPLPSTPGFLFIGRLIKDKGVVEYLDACRLIRRFRTDVRCMIVGPFDSNPSALTHEELDPYIDDGTVEYYPEQEDVRPFFAACSTYVLPSYHEGTPKTVLEAMAMGRSVITTNAPGCRETVVDGVNGYLVDVKDVRGLVDKMIYLSENLLIARDMGLKGRELAELKYDVRKVNGVILYAMGL